MIVMCKVPYKNDCLDKDYFDAIMSPLSLFNGGWLNFLISFFVYSDVYFLIGKLKQEMLDEGKINQLILCAPNFLLIKLQVPAYQLNFRTNQAPHCSRVGRENIKQSKDKK